jgi:phosphoribosyl 1,2-cyclic phosphodiesterase
MLLQFTVLASGSSGNASLLRFRHFGLLVDAGLGPRLLAERLGQIGASWDDIHAVLLTHTHGDHWAERTLIHLSRRRIPLYCHAGHHHGLQHYSPTFVAMREQQLVLEYETGRAFELVPGLTCLPVMLRHDCGATFGFRFEICGTEIGERRALAYAADLGTWDAHITGALADVDLLALEFNHDVNMEQASGRSRSLIKRVLSDYGHLSNAQASALLEAILRRSSPGRLRHLVQLHLSRDCNRPALARSAAQGILRALAPWVELHTASQAGVSPTFVLSTPHYPAALASMTRLAARGVRFKELVKSVQPLLPCMAD